jgi:hypothetical protein
MFLRKTLRDLTTLPTGKLLDQRYGKFRRMGVFLETAASLAESAPAAPAADAAAN